MDKKALKYACFIVFLAFFGTAGFAHAAGESNRYFLKSTSPIVKKSFGVRHSFNNGFTSDLTGFQLRLAKFFGVEVEPVARLNILPSSEQPLDPADNGDGITGLGKAIKRAVPSSQVPWGVKLLEDLQGAELPKGGKGVKVAVLDTGVAVNHPDLLSRVYDCKDFTSPRFPVVDGKCVDKNGHGTHVAGIIAADGGKDGLGIFGMAPQADLLVYKVCRDNGSCWADDITAAISMAVDSGAQIINLSLGSDSAIPLVKSGIDYSTANGVLIVAAAGNDGPDISSVDYPAFYADVMAVGALNSDSGIPAWSSRGSNSLTVPNIIEDGDLEFGAPGVIIESTWKDGGYALLSGTSMASPHIAGLAARLWQSEEDEPAEATRALLKFFARDILPFGEDNASGYGMPAL